MRRADSAIILAGGRSTRMGYDKALLAVEGIRIVDILAQALLSRFAQVILVSNNLELLPPTGVQLVSDTLADMGPLGGIHAGLSISDSEYSLITACDMPNLNLPYVEFMRAKLYAQDVPISVLATQFGEHMEPLTAFYNRSLANKIEQYCLSGSRGLNRFLSAQGVTLIDEVTARTFSPDWSMFMNLNTEQEYQAFLSDNTRRLAPCQSVNRSE